MEQDKDSDEEHLLIRDEGQVSKRGSISSTSSSITSGSTVEYRDGQFPASPVSRSRSLSPDDEGAGRSDEGFYDEDEEWSSPVTKILKLPLDHESWQHAQEILEAPSALSRKVGDEARSIAARHIIDRLKEDQLLNKIHKVAPRLRSAVELLSKPDGDYVFPKFKFVLHELRKRYPEVYTSVIDNVNLKIPEDMKPSTMLVSLSKSTVENESGEPEMSWGKFVALLGLAGALATDAVKAGYPEGVAEIVETFGVIVEQVVGEWILNEGGGWEGFIQMNTYEATLPPVPRTLIILTCLSIVFYVTLRVVLFSSALIISVISPELTFWQKWYSATPQSYYFEREFCFRDRTPVEFIFRMNEL